MKMYIASKRLQMQLTDKNLSIPLSSSLGVPHAVFSDQSFTVYNIIYIDEMTRPTSTCKIILLFVWKLVLVQLFKTEQLYNSSLKFVSRYKIIIIVLVYSQFVNQCHRLDTLFLVSAYKNDPISPGRHSSVSACLKQCLKQHLVLLSHCSVFMMFRGSKFSRTAVLDNFVEKKFSNAADDGTKCRNFR